MVMYHPDNGQRSYKSSVTSAEYTYLLNKLMNSGNDNGTLHAQCLPHTP